MERPIEMPSVGAMPGRLSDIARLLQRAGRELRKNFVHDRVVWWPIARASVKARFAARDLRAIVAAAERAIEVKDPPTMLMARLEEITAIWPEVKRYLRFGPRGVKDVRLSEPV